MLRTTIVLCWMMLSFLAVKAEDGNIQIINLSPDSSMNLVEVSIGDSIIADSLAFNEATAYLTIPEGPAQILTFTSVKYPDESFQLTGLNIDSAGFYQSILYGVQSIVGYTLNPEGIDRLLNATFNTIDTSGIASDEIRVNFFHAVADAVELDVADFLLEYIVDNMAFTEYSSNSVDFIKDVRNLFFTSTDSIVTVASRTADLTLFSGNHLTIFLSGFIVTGDNRNGPGFGLYGVDSDGNVIALDLISSVLTDAYLADLTLAPNPAKGHTILQFNNQHITNFQTSLIDVSGKEWILEAINAEEGYNQVRIALPQVPSGLYFLMLHAPEGNQALPLVITQ